MVAGRLALLGLALSLLAQGLAGAPQELVLRGEAACLDDQGVRVGTGAECPDEPLGGWAIRTADGSLHPLSDDDPRVVILSDERVRSRELQVTAWRGADGALAIVHLRTIVDGRLRDPHYYCPVCSIRSSAPGPCWCCRAPFEFREPALEGAAGEPAPRPER
jgi:hypothetical protein